MKNQQNILIVDDKEQNLFALERILQRVDAQIIRATCGNDALTASLNHEFALAILDVQMPGMDGYELAELFRSDEKTRHLPIIFLTAVYSDEYHVFKGYEAGAVDFLTKPFQSEILLAKVRIFLQLEDQHQRLKKIIDLEKTKNHLENILLSMSDVVLVLSRDGVIQTINEAALSLLGYPRGQIMGLPFCDLLATDEVFPWIISEKKEFALNYMENPTYHNIEANILTKHKEAIPVLISGSDFHDKDNLLLGTVIVARDIRERKALEQQRIMTEKITALGMLAGGMAHELNNPLMGINGFIEYCLKHTPKEDKRHEILEDAGKETRRCMDLVKNLLTFSHTEPLSDEQCQWVDIETLFDRVLRLLAYRIEKDNVLVIKQISVDSNTIYTQGNSLQQVFLNFMTNALDAVSNNAEKKICFTVDRIQDNVRIVISDTGTGILPEHMDRIFDPFFTTKPVGKGTGLGLCVSKSIVESLGGKMCCESMPGKGTKFEVLLPGRKNEKLKQEGDK
ncbi:MAG: response regulator [Deltaproteobacteria bacterium]|uniref:ATP-binding response regulator n=1 Tax=Desulfobacula sp. TaxID=2593537 RepID=UPI0019977E70|nr:response regulator [Candidatus Desulfobacula maris]MBL6993099.1 response regulator [Desulfobacula sp.]